MNLDAIDWDSLERLRANFLSGVTGTKDYWQSESDLASYDATFAQRIGWKWDYVLSELQQRGWSPPAGGLLDWGCGSGVAGRAFLDQFGCDTVSTFQVWDRSALAMKFAAARMREKYPRLDVTVQRDDPLRDASRPTTLLISHVLNELTAEKTQALADFAAKATSVVWVEPGTYEASLTLIAIRERLRKDMNVIAPCTHGARCGILAPGNERHWCHHFASPPPEIFTDANWSRFANELGIDLRDLPLSFLVLDKRPAPPLAEGATRVIGHPRLYKAHALMLGCDECGVREGRLMKRHHPDVFKSLKKGRSEKLVAWHREGDEITRIKPLFQPVSV